MRLKQKILNTNLGGCHPSTRENELLEEIKRQKTVIVNWKGEAKAFTGLDEQIKKLEANLTEFGDVKSQSVIHQNTAKGRKKAEKQLGELQTVLTKYRAQMIEIDLTLQTHANLEDTIQRIQNEKVTYQTDHEQYLSNKQIAQQLEKRTQNVNDIQDKLTNATKANQKKEKELKTLQGHYDLADHMLVEKNYDRLNKEHGRLESKIEMLEQRYKDIKNNIESLLPLEKELSINETNLRQLSSSLAVLVFLRKSIREAGPHIVRQLLQAISEEADQIYSEIISDYTAHLQWTEDYEIMIERKGYIREFSQLSGGEKMAAALAVRLALLREMSEIRIAFFDEPTANLDDERKNNLAEQMTKIKGFDQLFVISHDDTFEHQTDHILHVYKEDGASHIV